ncbi:MAG: hypothetical protein IJH77_04455 [Mogibacterium sp.]|nr:hypothetical protein [Mogibacterium sp.]
MTIRSWGKLIAALLVIAALGYAGSRYLQLQESNEKAEAVLEKMQMVIPNLGVETGESTGNGKDPLTVITLNEVDIVGCLEIPALDIMVPVTAQKQEQEGFVTWVSGSPVKGHFRLVGGRSDVFRTLTKANPGDAVIFTDVDGIRYHYQVTTQFHLKNWDESDQSLMLCYETDEQTQFVLGCAEVSG